MNTRIKALFDTKMTWPKEMWVQSIRYSRWKKMLESWNTKGKLTETEISIRDVGEWWTSQHVDIPTTPFGIKGDRIIIIIILYIFPFPLCFTHLTGLYIMPREYLNKADNCMARWLLHLKSKIELLLWKKGYQLNFWMQTWSRRQEIDTTLYLCNKSQLIANQKVLRLPVILREPIDHTTDRNCCMLLPVGKGLLKKKKRNGHYNIQTIPSALRTVSHNKGTHIPEAPGLYEIDSDDWPELSTSYD